MAIQYATLSITLVQRIVMCDLCRKSAFYPFGEMSYDHPPKTLNLRLRSQLEMTASPFYEMGPDASDALILAKADEVGWKIEHYHGIDLSLCPECANQS